MAESNEKEPKPVEAALEELEEAYFDEALEAAMERRRMLFDPKDRKRARQTKKADLEDDITDMQERREKLDEEQRITGDPEVVRQGQFLGKEALNAEIELERLRTEEAQDPLPPEKD